MKQQKPLTREAAAPGVGGGHFRLSGADLSGGAGPGKVGGRIGRTRPGSPPAHRREDLPPVAKDLCRAGLWAVFAGQVGLDGLARGPFLGMGLGCFWRRLAGSCRNGGRADHVAILVPAAWTEIWRSAKGTVAVLRRRAAFCGRNNDTAVVCLQSKFFGVLSYCHGGGTQGSVAN